MHIQVEVSPTLLNLVHRIQEVERKYDIADDLIANMHELIDEQIQNLREEHADAIGETVAEED